MATLRLSEEELAELTDYRQPKKSSNACAQRASGVRAFQTLVDA